MAETVTALLQRWRAGDQAARDALIPLVYDELRALAARHLRGERAGHTFRPTELVSEVYLRLTGGANPDWNDRVHFFAIAARTMRQILIDHARRKRAGKRGAGARPIELDEGLVAADRPGDLLALDEALTALARFDERKARAVELCYFGGLSQEDAAKVLAVHTNTIARDLRLAEAWIHQQLRGGS